MPNGCKTSLAASGLVRALSSSFFARPAEVVDSELNLLKLGAAYFDKKMKRKEKILIIIAHSVNEVFESAISAQSCVCKNGSCGCIQKPCKCLSYGRLLTPTKMFI